MGIKEIKRNFQVDIINKSIDVSLLKSEMRNIKDKSSSKKTDEKRNKLLFSLSSLGFTNSATYNILECDSKKVKKDDKIDEFTESERKLVEKVKKSLPWMPILKVSDLNEICDRYGFIQTSTSRYLGRISMDCIDDMESFRNHKLDYFDEVYGSVVVELRYSNKSLLFRKERKIIKNKMDKLYPYMYSKFHRSISFSLPDKLPNLGFSDSDLKTILLDNPEWSKVDYSSEYLSEHKLFICADRRLCKDSFVYRYEKEKSVSPEDLLKINDDLIIYTYLSENLVGIVSTQGLLDSENFKTMYEVSMEDIH